MATMIDGESYIGRVLIRPLSQAGDLRLYLWPLRCLKSQMGGPTFGIEVKGEEILRFDAHGPRGHWHQGGYDKLGAGGSHQGFPEGVVETASQLAWSLAHLRAHAQQLLADAGYPAAAASLDPALLAAALDAVQAHVEQEGDLRAHAIAQGLLVVERSCPFPGGPLGWVCHTLPRPPVWVLRAAPVPRRSRRGRRRWRGPWQTTRQGQTCATATAACAQSLEGHCVPPLLDSTAGHT
jgi:hypothetical protein